MINDIIQKKIIELPVNIQRAIKEFDWAKEVLHIAHDHQLQIDTIDTFRQETLLVITGLTQAADFGKNLVSHLHIPESLAEKLVMDANEHIFRPIQKIAFTHHEDNELESEVIEHTRLSDVMSDHGVELVDEFETESKPQNDLQDLADGIFQLKNKDVPPQKEETVEEITQEEEKEPLSYNEPIDESDLAGITGHRIDTSILKQARPESILNKETQTADLANSDSLLASSNFNETKISKTELFNVSPTEKELVTENGEFLKHIGAV